MPAETLDHAAPAGAPGRADLVQFVAFESGGERYAVEIATVREMRAWTGATPIPKAAPFVRGMINLRGAILPVVDLAARIGRAPCEAGPTHVIVVLAAGARLVGLLVDAVTDILAVAPGEVLPVPGGAGAEELIGGVLARDGGMVSVLRAERLLGGAPG
jgi:purine-binding chemotaxis protein CheW